ncbi:hypothetical protein [Amnibacterium setariae]|uniref:Uncharacterized protein n=1 Tax=Amnibacterium setariae TaxID=2306585 RepID=A0A3A1TY04_9MICO|nr:hypothetical protein [Amnibacterium setariae]RIX27555.1 hypothetical protein D1781_08225 [Amnibacterium setariae]
MSSGIVRIVLGAVLTVFLGSWALASLGLLLGGLAQGGNGAQLIGNVLGFLLAAALTLLAARNLLLKGLAQRQAARAARASGDR